MSEVEDKNGEIKEKIEFKKKKRKNLRQKIKTEESDDEETVQISNKLEEMKEIQNLRKRPHGVSVIGLALGTKVSVEAEVVSKDPFKVETGGMVNMQALKSGKVKQVDDAYDTGIGTQFSVETNKRDEDEEMMKYIEEELSKRKGKTEHEEPSSSEKKKSYLTPEEAALQAVPEHLRESSAKRSEEMLSNQMLSGIPEVDLGIEAKIKNIEATEEAKLRLLWEKQNKKDGPSQFVPTNMAVNFVQHNRFNVDQTEVAKKKAKVEVEEHKPKTKDEKATDDYHFERENYSDPGSSFIETQPNSDSNSNLDITNSEQFFIDEKITIEELELNQKIPEEIYPGFRIEYDKSTAITNISYKGEKFFDKSSGRERIKCPNCYFLTDNLGNLKQHIQVHLKPEGDISCYQCEFCNFRTKYKNSIKGHVLRHSVVKKRDRKKKKKK